MIIVTGASGFIGSNLIKELINRGEKNIIAVDYVVRDYLKDYPILFCGAEEFYNDLPNYCKGVSTIYHEGAISSTTETNISELSKKNILPSYELIYYCRSNNIQLQYASSASVYGNLSKKEWYHKNKKMNPLNEYAKSKKSVDYFFDLILNSSKPPLLIQGMRYFNVFGENENHKIGQSSPHHAFKKQFFETGKIKLFEGSKKFYRDFIPVEKVIEIKLNAIKDNPSGIYDVGTGNPKSFYDVAIEICGSENNIEWIPMPENLKRHYQKYSCADMEWYKKPIER